MQNVSTWSLALLCLLGSQAISPVTAHAQNKKAPPRESAKSAEREGSTIRGRLVVPEKQRAAVDLTQFEAILLERVELPAPPVPENWNTFTAEQNQAWWAEFQNSEAGKAFLAERQRLQESAKVFKIRWEPDGKFVLYDVPPGVYSLQGYLEMPLNDIVHALELFGELTVSSGADEIVIGDVPLEITPLWENGQSVPNISGKTLDGKPVTLSNKPGSPRHMLLFWSRESVPANDILKRLTEWRAARGDAPQIPLWIIALDADDAELRKALSESPLPTDTTVVAGEGWQGPWTVGLGVRGVPSLWLIEDGKFKMTDFELGVALQVGKLSLPETLSRLWDNQAIPNYPPPLPTEEADGDGDGDGGNIPTPEAGATNKGGR